MKRIIALLLILALAGVGSAGCGAKDKLEEKAAEKLTEKVLEQGGAQDVDIDGDTIKVKGEDGTEVTIGGTEWPDSEMGKLIPEFKDGELSGTVETPGYLMINFEEVDPSDAADYIEKNKPNFTLDNYESKADGMISWSGKNDQGLQLALTLSDTTFTVMMYQEESQQDKSQTE